MRRWVAGALAGVTMSGLLSAGAVAQGCDRRVSDLLASFEGSWSVEASRRVEPGLFEELRGEATVELGLAGCAIIERRRLASSSTERTSVATIAASPRGLQLAVVDSEHGTFTVSDGSAESGRLSFTWSRDLGDRVMSTRTELVVVSSRRLEERRMLQRTSDAEWELTFSAVLTPVGR